MDSLTPNGQPTSGTANANPAALAASANILGSAAGAGNARGGVVYRASMLNTNAAARWMQFFDAQALPADGAVPIISIPVAIGAFVNVDFGVHGKAFKLGCFICTSTTAATKTIGAADALIEATYKAG